MRYHCAVLLVISNRITQEYKHDVCDQKIR